MDVPVKNPLPVQAENSRTLAILMLVIMLTLLVSFLPARWFGINPAQQKYAKIDLSNVDSVDDLAQDTNGDGVTDWSEIIAQTYGGSEESIQAAKDTPVDATSLAQLNDPNNLTSSLSKNLYVASAYLSQAGATGEGAKKDIVENLLKEEAGKISFTTYTYKDLSVDSKETPATVHLYGNKLGALVQTAMNEGLGVNDIDNLKSFLDTKNRKAYNALVNKRDTANYIVSEMLTMSVPLSASIYHVLTLNRVAAYRDTLDNILKIETDPVRSAIAFNGYVKVTTDMLSSATLLSDYFRTKGVVFTQKEAGYVFDPRYTIDTQ